MLRLGGGGRIGDSQRWRRFFSRVSLFLLTGIFATLLPAATVYDDSDSSVEALTLSSGDYEFARTDSKYVVNNLTLSGGKVKITGSGGNQIGSSVVVTNAGGLLDLNGHNETLTSFEQSTASDTAVYITNSTKDSSKATLTLKPTGTVSNTINGGIQYITLVVDYGAGALTLGGDKLSANNEATTIRMVSGTLNLNKTDFNAAHFLIQNGGTVRLTGKGGNQLSDTRVQIINGGVFDLYGHSETIGMLQQTTKNANAEITNTQTGLSQLNITGSTGQTNPYFGKFTGNLGLIFSNGNTMETANLLLNGENTYTGGTLIEKSWVRFNSSGTLGADGKIESGCFGTGAITLNNGGISNNGGSRIGGTDEVLHLYNDILIASGGGKIEVGWGSNKNTFAEAVQDAKAFVGNRADHWYLILDGKISDSNANTPGSLTICWNGGWTVLTNPNNNYSGKTILGAAGNTTSTATARLAIMANDALSANSVMEFVKVSGHVESLLDLYGYSATIAGVTGDQGSILNSGNSASTLTIAVDTGESYSWNGTVKNAISLVKTGAGTQTLTGTLSHTGTTLVEDGVLVVDTALAGSEVVLAGGKFSLGTKGSYTTTDTVRVVAGSDDAQVSSLDASVPFSVQVESGGIFSPGDTTDPYGNSTFAAGKTLTIQEGGVLQIDIFDASRYDTLSVDTLDMTDGGLVLNLAADVDWHSLGQLDLGTIGNLASLDVSTWLSGAQQHYFNVWGEGGQLYLGVDRAAVPEPGSWILLAMGLAVWGCLRRGKQRF
ncbi:MAG: autotransporter-associated beta strand repeat-containing protein [Planctomycetia bacterium]|nr:autotransporter-associated beta strand repeat-containing protein [Planctomycetia bacterium]